MRAAGALDVWFITVLRRPQKAFVYPAGHGEHALRLNATVPRQVSAATRTQPVRSGHQPGGCCASAVVRSCLPRTASSASRRKIDLVGHNPRWGPEASERGTRRTHSTRATARQPSLPAAVIRRRNSARYSYPGMGITGTTRSPARSRGRAVQVIAVAAPNRLGDVSVLGLAITSETG